MMTIQYASTDTLNIAYLEAGSPGAPVVLLLHGWPDDATTWAEVMPRLAEAGLRVIAPWLRGYGTTTFLRSDSPRTANSGILAFDAIGLLDTLSIQACSVVGHDWGANVAEALAVGWPERIRRMVLLSSPPRLGGVPTPPFAQTQRQWYHWFQATKRGEAAVRADPMGFARIMWDNWSPRGWYTPELFDRVAQSWHNPDFVDITLHSYRARWDEAPPDPRSAELEAKIKATQTLSLPTLYVQGEVDGVNPPSASEDVPKKFTGSFERIIMPGVGHFPSREAPGQLVDQLLKQLID